MKISDGCDRHCAFCAIPLIKGTYETVGPGRRSWRPPRRALCRRAPASSSWSARTRSAGSGQATVACRVCWAICGPWGPFGYGCSTCSPTALSGGRSRGSGGRTACRTSTCPCSTPRGRVLRAMGRRGDGDAVSGAAGAASAHACRRPPCARPSSPAFPGETDDDVEELLDFIDAGGPGRRRRLRLRPAGGHARRPCCPRQVPGRLREERAARVGDAVARAARSLLGPFVGRTVDVLVEQGSPWRVARGDW